MTHLLSTEESSILYGVESYINHRAVDIISTIANELVETGIKKSSVHAIQSRLRDAHVILRAGDGFSSISNQELDDRIDITLAHFFKKYTQRTDKIQKLLMSTSMS